MKTRILLLLLLPLRLLAAMRRLILLCLLLAAALDLAADRRALLMSAPKPAAGGGGFVPTDISGLQLWFQADDGVTNASNVSPPADGEGVKGWYDKSGNARFLLSPGGGNAPTYETGVQNGKPAVRFASASSQFLSNSFGSTLNGSDVSATFVAMMSVAVTNSANYPFFVRNGVDGDSAWLSGISGGGQYISFKRDDGAISDTVLGNGPNTSTFYNITWVINGTSCVIYTNNVQVVSDTLDVGATTFDSTWVGRFTTYLNGDIGELLVYDSALSVGNRTSVYDYLKTRWGTP